MSASNTPNKLIVEADGGSRGNPGPAGFGAIVKDAQTGTILAQRAEHLGIATNNVAEYRGLIAGLRAAAEINPTASVVARMDSKLVVEQMSGRWKIKHPDMRELALEARDILPTSNVEYEWIPRAQNTIADGLANDAMDGGDGTIISNSPAGAEASPAGAETKQPAGSPSGAPPSFRTEMPVTLALVRHGVTPLTISRKFSGSGGPDPHLTRQGVAQARSAIPILERIGQDDWSDLERPTWIISSPLQRTKDTAREIARGLGLGTAVRSIDEGFAEVNFGQWDGLLRAEIMEQYPDQLPRWFAGEIAAPGGESLPEVGARVQAALVRAAKAHAGETVVVTSHVNAIRAAVGITLEIPRERWSQLRVPPASVTILRFWPDGWGELTALGLTP